MTFNVLLSSVSRGHESGSLPKRVFERMSLKPNRDENTEHYLDLTLHFNLAVSSSLSKSKISAICVAKTVARIPSGSFGSGE
jgi:hypothetical protein